MGIASGSRGTAEAGEMSDPSCDIANWTFIAKNTLFSKT